MKHVDSLIALYFSVLEFSMFSPSIQWAWHRVRECRRSRIKAPWLHLLFGELAMSKALQELVECIVACAQQGQGRMRIGCGLRVDEG